MVLEEFSAQLHDPLNYGLYIPPNAGKAGKFLDEERPLEDYKLPGKLLMISLGLHGVGLH